MTVCTVEGRVGGTKIAGLGTVAETRRAPEWEELDLLRAISAVFEPGLAALAIARRPRGAEDHGSELVTAALVEAGELRAPEDARISTVYDGGGRQHSSGLELWFPGEDYPAPAVRHGPGGHLARARGAVRPRRGVHLADGGPRRRRPLRAHAAQ